MKKEIINFKRTDELPHPKAELPFSDIFGHDIFEGNKWETYRNSPVDLGIYEYHGFIFEYIGFQIEVYACTKITSRNPAESIVFREGLGFESEEEMRRYYREYFKKDRDFVYLIEWERV